MRSRRIRLVLALVILASAASLVSCKRVVQEVKSIWPKAERERTVPKPADPLRWPYTGADVTDASAATRRPLSIKVENSPASRPQEGLSYADVVYETITEGGITRFNAIYHSQIPDRVVPVRSARLSDLWIVPQYDGLFFFSGASSTVNARVNANKQIPNLSEDAGISYPYARSEQRRAPHNLILDTVKAYEEAKRRGHSVNAKLEPLQFERRGVDVTLTASQVDIPFSQANRVRWTYDSVSGRYLRENNGAKHVDKATGEQLAADNVVVLWARYTRQSRDKVGSTTYDITLGGTGRATIFREGMKLDCTWEATKDAPPRFKDANGRAVRLVEGQTWFQVIPLDGNISIK